MKRTIFALLAAASLSGHAATVTVTPSDVTDPVITLTVTSATTFDVGGAGGKNAVGLLLATDTVALAGTFTNRAVRVDGGNVAADAPLQLQLRGATITGNGTAYEPLSLTGKARAALTLRGSSTLAPPSGNLTALRVPSYAADNYCSLTIAGDGALTAVGSGTGAGIGGGAEANVGVAGGENGGEIIIEGGAE
ncbi:MAG: hypothetical protein LBS63_01280, partial [Prevotellaceae bacterium]|nr:hypothetical protein [Prevotellaceae bacterium]